MKKTPFRLFALVIVAFSLVATACFQIRALIPYGDRVLSNGDVASFKVDLYRQSDDGDTTGRIFLLVGTSSTLPLKSVSEFDTDGNFGGPFTKTSSNTIRNYILDNDKCIGGGVNASTIEGSYANWYLYRTNSTVASSSGTFSERNRVRVNFQRSGGTNGSYGSFVIFAGTWGDTAPLGVPDGTDVFQCTSMVISSVPFGP